MDVDREFALVRLAILLIGLALAAWRLSALSRRQDPRRLLRVSSLVVLGLFSFASFYYFFQLRHPGGFEPEDVFPYYLGSKYFEEIGYFGLYDASLLALVEAGKQDLDRLESVRDLSDGHVYPAKRAIQRGHKFRSRFSDERWERFSKDVIFIRSRMSDSQYAHMMIDHGYHPSPVWTWLGGQFSGRVDPGPHFIRLIQLDRGIVVLALLACAFAFGPEIGALAAVVWGTGFLWRYGWVGDSFLRQSWFGATILGLALARRGWLGGSGSFLALAAWLRLFPGVFALGWLARAGRESWEARRPTNASLRFLAGALLTSLIVVGASLSVTDEPADLYPDFARKIGKFADSSAINKIGFGVIERALVEVGPRQSIAGTQVTRPSPLFRTALSVLHWVLVAGALLLFARALRGCEPWESAAASFALIPILVDPTGYYYSFCVAGVLLSERRPRIALWVMGACAAWPVAGLIFYREPASYLAASIISLSLSAAVLFELGRPALSSTASIRPNRNESSKRSSLSSAPDMPV